MKSIKSLAVAASLALGVIAMPTSGNAGVHLKVPHMYQPDGETCFPTSFMMALNYMGLIDDFSSATIQDLHKYCQYNRFNAPGIAKQYGLYALPNWHNLGWTRETIKRELDLGRPVILGINSGRSGHFILAIGYTDDDKLIINNPTKPGGVNIGGHDKVISWDQIIWRGGVILRPEPFPEGPALSGVAVGRNGLPLEETRNLRITSGEDAEVSFTLVNNGRAAWPDKLYLAPVDPDSSPTKALKSKIGEGWISAERVCESLPSLAPGTTGTISFKVKAPDVTETSSILEYYQLVDGDGNWFGTSWLAGPGNRNMGVRMIILPKDRSEFKLPLVAATSPSDPKLPWKVRYGKVELAPDFKPAPPTSSPVNLLHTPGQVSDTAWLGDPEAKDYRIEAWVYCEMRVDLDPVGYERVGIFARDNGQHAADTKNEVEIGHCLAMAIDSDDGTIRAGNVYNGTIDGYRKDRFKLKESGWHKFAMTCKGSTVIYELDDKPFHTQKKVRGFKEGECGVFYNSFLPTTLPADKGSHGIHFSDVKITDVK